jgi:hypothetical protein
MLYGRMVFSVSFFFSFAAQTAAYSYYNENTVGFMGQPVACGKSAL